MTLVDAKTVAAELGVTPEWVREHKDQLGVIRIGNGSRPRLRFDMDIVLERLEMPRSVQRMRSVLGREAGPITPPSRRQVPLLPIKGIDK